MREMKPTDEELYNKGLTRNESRSARGVYIGREAGQFLFDLWRNGQIKGKRAAESVEIICKMSEYITDAQKKNDVQAMAAKLLADGESWDCINVAIQTMAARDMEAKSGKMKQGWLFFGAGFEEELKQRGRFAARSIEFLRQKIKAGEGAQRASENAEEVARQGYTVTRKEGSEEYTLEELVRLMERFKHMVNDAELMRDSLEWDGQSELDPVARYLTPERKVDMEEQMRREQEEKEREAREYLEAHVDSLFGADGMGSAQMVGGAGAPYVRGTMYDVRFGSSRASRGEGDVSMSAQMVERNEETRAARERYAGTEAAKAVEKVVTSLRGKVKDAVTRAELEERVPEEDRKGLISQEEELIMPANEGVIDAVKAATGRDVTGYYHAVSEDRLWHAILHHGQDSTSTQHVGQLDLTWDDFALLPDILDTGTPEVKSYPKSDTIIEYTKDYNGVVYKVRQRVGRKRRFHESKLSFVTEWIEKRRGSQGVSPDHVQGHSLGFPRDAIQSQGSEDVKGDVSMSVRQARERGLMKDGVMELGNGVLVDGRSDDFSASVRGAQSASPALYREPNLDKVGTGEGNQTEGWGLYWSTRWEANAFYHKAFTNISTPIAPGSKEERLMRLLGEALNVNDGDERALYDLGKAIENSERDELRDELYSALENKGASDEDLDFFFKAFENMDIYGEYLGDGKFLIEVDTLVNDDRVVIRINPEGKYAVNYLADLDVDDSNVLHWDEPASRLFDEHPGLLEAYRNEGGEYTGKEKGKDVYWGLARALGSDKAASQWLDARGIRGNKYLDGMSRRHEDVEKMYNYVIFNEDYIKITRINNRHPWSEYSEDNPDWQKPGDVSFSMVERDLYRELHGAFKQVKEKDGKKVWVKSVKKGTIFRICPYPDIFARLREWKGNVVMRADVVKKLLNKHNFSLHDVARLPYALWDPVVIFEEKAQAGDEKKGIQGRFVVVTDIQVENQKGERKSAMGVLTLRVDKEGAEITDVVTAFSREEAGKYKNLLEGRQLLYADTERARDWAREEGRTISQLLTTSLAEPGSGVMLKEDLPDVNFNFPGGDRKNVPGVDFSSAMRRARELELTRRVHELLLGRREEREAKAMVEAWDAWMERFKAVMAGKEGEKSRLGRGMEALARMVALLESTRAALPGRYRVGWLDVQLRWATWYAQMMESGEVTLSEELKDDKRYAAWAARFRDEVARKEGFGVSEQGLKEFLADMVGKRMDAVLENVAAKCRRTLERFLKDRARERMDDIARRLYPKRERGRAWPRGKADAETYRFVQDAYKHMDAKPGEKGESGDYEAETERLERLLEEETDEGKRAELSKEVMMRRMFGEWGKMSYEQALAAEEYFTERVMSGRDAWAEKQQARREKIAYMKAKVRETKGWKGYGEEATINAQVEETAAKGTGLKNVLNFPFYAFTSFTGKMMGWRKELGGWFAERMSRKWAQMNVGIKGRTDELQAWFMQAVGTVSGRKTAEGIADWIREQNVLMDTGITLVRKDSTTRRITAEEAQEYRGVADERAADAAGDGEGAGAAGAGGEFAEEGEPGRGDDEEVGEGEMGEAGGAGAAYAGEELEGADG